MGVAGDAKLDKKVVEKARERERDNGLAEWRGFINVNLDPSQKSQFEEWVRTDEPWDVLGELVGSGAHIAIKPDAGGGGFMASVTQRNPLHVNAGLCITARSREAPKALFRAVYLAFVLGVNPDWRKGQAPADPDRW